MKKLLRRVDKQLAGRGEERPGVRRLGGGAAGGEGNDLGEDVEGEVAADEDVGDRQGAVSRGDASVSNFGDLEGVCVVGPHDGDATWPDVGAAAPVVGGHHCGGAINAPQVLLRLCSSCHDVL